MGLDSYLFREEPGDTRFDLPHSLCGSFFFSNHGEDGSFRGKVYDDLIYEVTGYTLYTEEYTPEQVVDIADRLGRLGKVQIKDLAAKHGCTVEEIEALVTLFQQAKEKGCRYMGWW